MQLPCMPQGAPAEQMEAMSACPRPSGSSSAVPVRGPPPCMPMAEYLHTIPCTEPSAYSDKGACYLQAGLSKQQCCRDKATSECGQEVACRSKAGDSAAAAPSRAAWRSGARRVITRAQSLPSTSSSSSTCTLNRLALGGCGPLEMALQCTCKQVRLTALQSTCACDQAAHRLCLAC